MRTLHSSELRQPLERRLDLGRGVLVVDQIPIEVLLVRTEVEQPVAAEVEDDAPFTGFGPGEIGHGGDGVGGLGRGDNALGAGEEDGGLEDACLGYGAG